MHTLGVRTGYTQADVTNFAKVLTGWTWFPPFEPIHGGEFVFDPILHEPGDQIVLGKRYPENGVQQGRAVLADLARHPATAHHIAHELAAHFVADEPPPTLVAKLEKTFNDSGGNLKAVAKTLITADESWTPQRTKLKAAGRMDRRRAAAHRRRPSHPDRTGDGSAGSAWRRAVAATGAKRLLRSRGGMD